MTVTTESAEAAPQADRPAPTAPRLGVGRRLHSVLGAVPTFFLWAIVALWSLPTLGILVSSFRAEDDVKSSGWWRFYEDNGLTMANYRSVFSSSTSDAPDMWQHFFNSIAITVPATVIPIAIAAFAAYAFAWMDFPGRHWLFVSVVALLAVPLQMSLIPLLQMFGGGAHLTLLGQTVTVFPDFDLQNSTTAVWLTHIGFGLPLAIFLLHNYISSLPQDLLEAARIDGADHPTIFWRLVMPLSIPALAAFAIFQFLWVWNDYLVARTFLGSGGGGIENAPMTIRVATLSGSRGQDWHLLTAAAFVSIAVPLLVFFALQRYFVRGLLAGSVKG